MKKTEDSLVLVFLPLIILGVVLSSSHASLDRIAPTVQAPPGSDASFSNIVVIMMENKNLADIIGNPSAPYENQLAKNYSYATSYKQVSNNGSLPEYLAVLSGNPFDGSVTSPTWGACNSLPNSTKCLSLGWPKGGDASTTLVQRFENSGITWKAYMENMPSNCYQNDTGNYVARHDPFVYFSFAQPNATDCSKVVPAGTGDSALLTDLGSSNAPNFMWLTPNICNDMSSCPVSTGDSYLQTLIPQILNSHIFTHNKAAIFITWDECNTICDSKLVPAIWAGSAVKNNFTSASPYTHYSLTKTIEWAWGLSPLTFTDACASVMTEFFTTPQTGPLQTSLSCTPSHPVVGKTVRFNGTAVGGSSPYGFSWNFGDNGTATGAKVSHTYNAAGHYLVSLNVTDASSKTAISSETIPVEDFTITARSANVIVNAGSSGTSGLNITALGEFSGTVSLTVTGSTGLTASVFPPSVVASGTATLAVSARMAGNYTATVIAFSGPLTHSTTVNVQVVDFNITASPTTIVVNAGVSGTLTITVIAVNHFTGTVSLTDTVPANLTCGAITPTTIANSGTATLACSSTIAATYNVTIIGTSGTSSHSTTATFKIIDFKIVATSPVAVQAGTLATSTITVTAVNGFTGTVSLTDSVPANLICGAIAPANVTNFGTATLSCSSTLAANYAVTLTGTSGTLSHSTNATFTVTDFTTSATSPAAFNAGVSATSTITVTALNGFTGTVSLTDAVPTNLTCGAISPTSVTNSGTATVSCSSTVAATYTLTITGTSGTRSNSTTAIFIVMDFNITANPSSITSSVGSAPNSTITMSSLGGFSGNVTLTATVQCSNNSGSGGGGGHALEMVPLPSCPTLPLNPAAVFVTMGGSVFSILTVNGSSTPAGNYMVTVTATSGNLVHSVLVNVTFTTSAIVSQATSLTADVGSNGASTLGIGGFTFEMIGLVLPLLALIWTTGSRNTRTRNIVHDSFSGHQNYRNTYSLVLAPNVGYVQVWKPSRDS